MIDQYRTPLSTKQNIEKFVFRQKKKKKKKCYFY